MIVEIDPHAGFCIGVRKAIQLAEQSAQHQPVYCLGQLMHNRQEMERLEKMGVRVISHEQLKTLKDARVIIRTHGEPPETYRLAEKNRIEIIDATCPIVSHLQMRIRQGAEGMEMRGGRLVILGKKDHPEVIGLLGNAGERAVVISSPGEVKTLDFSGPMILFAQTTLSPKLFSDILNAINKEIEDRPENAAVELITNDTICRHVTGREKHLEAFARKHEAILFVGDPASSNGQTLFSLVKKINPSSWFIRTEADIDLQWLKGKSSVGITGSNSTPIWQLERVFERIGKS
jgi:4-hydroxy-3-methylbut-2-enyl diphosphate reductase